MTLKQYSQLTKDQRDVEQFLFQRDIAGAWADVGTGKTVAALSAVLRLLNRFDCHRVLVVGPRLVAERVWHTEASEWEHLRGLRVSRIVGTPEERLAAMAVDADIYTITRDNVQWLEAQFLTKVGKVWHQVKRWPWDLVILDESQSFKSQASKRWKSMRRLRRLFRKIWLLTGSLMPNGYADLWSQLFLMDGGKRLGTSEDAYFRRWFRTELNDGIPTRTRLKGADKEIDAAISDVFCVMRDAQPPAPNNFITVTLSEAERKLYRKMARTSVLELGEEQITAVNAGVLWGKLLQMANGAVYDKDKRWHHIHSRKLDALQELLESLPRPVIIGYGFKHDVERILKACPPSMGRVRILRTAGSLDAWRRGEIDIGIMHPGSAGHGLNDLYVSGAENLIWYGLTPNREYYEQLNGRITGGHRRTGRKVCVHHILAQGTIDEDARALLEFKGDQAVAAQIRVAQKLKEGVCLDSSAS